jgi:hypothetical protein
MREKMEVHLNNAQFSGVLANEPGMFAQPSVAAYMDPGSLQAVHKLWTAGAPTIVFVIEDGFSAAAILSAVPGLQMMQVLDIKG